MIRSVSLLRKERIKPALTRNNFILLRGSSLWNISAIFWTGLMRASLGFFNPFIPTEIIAPNPVIPTVIYGIPHPKARPHFALKSRIWVQIKQIPDPENLLRTVMDGTIDFICFISEGSRFSWNLNIWMSFLRSVRAQTIARFIIIKNPQNQDLIWRIYSECVFLTDIQNLVYDP